MFIETIFRSRKVVQQYSYCSLWVLLIVMHWVMHKIITNIYFDTLIARLSARLLYYKHNFIYSSFQFYIPFLEHSINNTQCILVRNSSFSSLFKFLKPPIYIAWRFIIS